MSQQIKWTIIKDLKSQTLAIANTWAGQYRIRWIDRTFFLYVDGAYTACSRSIEKLRDDADHLLREGSLP